MCLKQPLKLLLHWRRLTRLITQKQPTCLTSIKFSTWIPVTSRGLSDALSCHIASNSEHNVSVLLTANAPGAPQVCRTLWTPPVEKNKKLQLSAHNAICICLSYGPIGLIETCPFCDDNEVYSCFEKSNHRGETCAGCFRTLAAMCLYQRRSPWFEWETAGLWAN